VVQMAALSQPQQSRGVGYAFGDVERVELSL
jgi:hypothetical protein